MTGRLILCASPIGNLADATPRLAQALSEADVVFAEDTRRAATLLRHLAVEKTTRSYFAANEARRAEEMARLLDQGLTVALLTDAGTPGVSDPGVSAVRAAHEAGASVTVVPGPSAVTAALAVSGFGADRFVFEGFLPRKPGQRGRRLEDLAADQRTVVLFSSPHRVVTDLTDLAAALGDDRRICVAREMTKVFEEIWWGSLPEAVEYWQSKTPRGEFTLVVDGLRRSARD